ENGKVYRYGEVLAGAWILARLLRPKLADDRLVGVWLPPGRGGGFTNMALALLGKTSSDLNYTSSPEVVRQCLRQAPDAGYPIRRVLTARQFCERVPFEADPGVELIYIEDFRKEVTRWQRLRAFLAVVLLPAWFLERFVYRVAGHRPGDLATVIFSSGSTG